MLKLALNTNIVFTHFTNDKTKIQGGKLIYQESPIRFTSH